ncbi:unnamed protein product [Mesocestoides corti]|uniref:BAR domain-containing protein n=1 Tax=Mesocestoides corti TaxID=53468 RepID=A0A0R3UJF6_MESCO|nr:unnamed protein product [Mesocestoides corti]
MAAFGKFIDAASTAINRATDRVQDKVLEKFDAKKQPKLTSSELLGKLEQDLATEMTQCELGDKLGLVLSQYGQTHMDIGVAERNLITDVQKSLLVTVKHYLDTVWPSINTQRRNLEFARLDFDSAKQKKEACTSEDKIRPLTAAFEAAQLKFNEQIAAARATTSQLKNVEETLREDLKAMAAAQMRYFNACQEQLRQLTSKLESAGLGA